MLGNICFLNLYLKARGYLGITDKKGRTSLHHSAINGHKRMTEMLCEFGQFENLLETPDNAGNTPLLACVKHNRPESVMTLLQYNCNVFHRNLKGDTCLHLVALNGSIATLPVIGSFLTEEIFQVRNRDGMTALEVARSLQDYEIVKEIEVIKRNITV